MEIKKGFSVLFCLVLILAVSGCSFDRSGQEAILQENETGSQSLRFDLSEMAAAQDRTIYSTQTSPYIQVSSTGDQYLVTLNLRPDNCIPFTMVEFNIYPKSGVTPSGYQVNIGDSVSNNCYGGDSGSQYNNAELQVVGGTMQIYRKQSTSAYVSKSGWWTTQVMHFRVENNRVTYWRDSEAKTTVFNMQLFALNGQPDTIGGRNYTIYAAFNRTVASGSQTGAGIGDVEVIFKNPAYANAYYGLLHNHSDYSDGDGTPFQAYTYARDTAHLDFFSLADHDYHKCGRSFDATPANWNNIKTTAASFNVDGQFVAFHGFEWSSDIWGHMAIINSDTYVSFKNTSYDTTPEIMTWLRATAQANTVAFFNHPALWYISNEFNHFAKDYTYITDRVVGIELFNGTNGFSRFFTNSTGYYSDITGGYYDEANYVSPTRTGFTNGYHIGASGSDDNHDATWGTVTDFRMAILAPELSKTALLAGMKARSFYSTLDKNLYLWFDSANSPMGSICSYGTNYFTIKAYDDDGESFLQVDLYRNGSVIKTWDTDDFSDPAYVYLEYPYTTSKFDCYYIKVTEADGDEAISSPIYTC